MIQRLRQRGPDGDIKRDIDHGPRAATQRGTLRAQGYVSVNTIPNAMPSKLVARPGDTFDFSRTPSLSSGPSFMRPRRP